jgi:hypothetical protein
LIVENKPGHILAPVRLLAEAGIDLRSLYLADTETFGIVRMIVSEGQKAADLLEANGFVVKITEVLAVEVPDRPGGLAHLLGAMDGSGINIEYMYAFPNRCGGQAVMIFRFNDPDAAIAQLQKSGINLLTSDELLK